MTLTAIIMMILFMITIWGGLVLSVVHLMRYAREQDNK